MIPKNLLLNNKKKSVLNKGIRGTDIRPRLSVFRSNRHIYAQLINDIKGTTIAEVHDKELGKVIKGKKPTEIAFALGQKIAEKCAKLKIKSAVFDRRGFKFHGRVSNIAEGARSGGLTI